MKAGRARFALMCKHFPQSRFRASCRAVFARTRDSTCRRAKASDSSPARTSADAQLAYFAGASLLSSSEKLKTNTSLSCLAMAWGSWAAATAKR